MTILFPAQVTDGLVPINYLILGILFLSVPLFFILTSLGWYYDKKLRVWSADYIVRFERNPYMYVPDTRNGVLDILFFLVLLKTLNDLFEKQNLDNSELQNMIQYLETYKQFDASVNQNMEDARALRREHDVKL